MNALVSALEGNKIVTRTENGAPTNATSGLRLLDFFGQGGALRSRSESDVIKLFKDAFNEDKLLAVKTLFYVRDIRGGQGEKRTFRILLKWLATEAPSIVRKNLKLIAEYGSYNDYRVLFGTPVEKDLIELVKNQVVEDLKSDRPSLLAKWLPSENASSEESKIQARKLAKALSLTPREYRKVLVTLREKIGIIESKMCDNDFGSINYEGVPSRAAMIYRKAFRKQDEARYTEYLSAVEKGEKTIKADTLYPYDLVSKVYNAYSQQSDFATIDAQWKALPNYFEGSEFNKWMAVVDVSGSMMCNSGLPMYSSIGLGLYCAERCTGPFKDKYITFTSTPQFLTVTGKTLYDKVRYTRSAGVGMSTNLQAVFDLVLNTAVSNRVSESDMPDTLVIITDTEFNHPQVGAKNTNLDVIKMKYVRAGYKMPRLVFWNVNARNDQSPVTVNDQGVVLVSGHSASTFKSLMQNKVVTPLGMFLETVNAERYNAVTV